MDQIPKHIAIIMDGNGRWAKERGKARTKGHFEGVKRVRDIAIYAKEKGVKCLTLYAFSTENWKRPTNEVSYLMSLPKYFFGTYMEEIMANDIKIEMIGERDNIPSAALEIFDKAIERSKHNRSMILNFAMNYGAIDEINEGIKKYTSEVLKGQRENDLKDDEFSAYLFTSSLPKVDLMIRTSGEKRLSNFLLYQLAYSELYFTDVYWPDFDHKEFDRALDDYKKRQRRYGGIDES